MAPATDESLVMQKILDLALENISLMIGEDHTVVNTSGEPVRPPSRPFVLKCENGRWSISPGPPHPLSIPKVKDKAKILKAAHRITELLTGEVPMRCQDVAVYLSMEERGYLEGHKDLFKAALIKEEPLGYLKDRHKILDLTLEIIRLLTGEECMVVRNLPQHKTDGKRQHLSRRARKRQGTSLPSPPRFPDSHTKQQKVLEQTNKMIESLTGEVSVRCQDVAVYLSMEEWKYLDEHKELYQEVMTKDQLPLMSMDEGLLERTVNGSVRSPSYDINRRIPGRSLGGDPWTPDICPEKSADRSLEWVDLFSESHKKMPPLRKQLPKPPRQRPCKGPFICSECGKCYRLKCYLVKHQKLHEAPLKKNLNGDVRYPGPAINRKLTEGSLEGSAEAPDICSERSARMSKPEDFPSESNNILSTSRKQLEPHKKRSRWGPFSCPECGKVFQQQCHLSRHRKRHAVVLPYPCSECGKAFVRKESLEEHLVAHTGKWPFSCPECGRGFTRKPALDYHLLAHTGERPFACRDCDQSYKCKSHLENHRLACHPGSDSGGAPFLCSECGECFKYKRQLYRHWKVHTGHGLFGCPECGKSFSEKCILDKHLRTHTEERPFCCPICGARFTQKFSLTCHLKALHRSTEGSSPSEKASKAKPELVTPQDGHEAEKIFSCSKCDKAFIKRAELLAHKRSHCEERPFRCPECGKCFSHRGALGTHVKLHTGEKSFSCNECGKCFLAKAQLLYHLTIHTGKKPYSCTECGEGFRTKAALVQHLGTHN